MPGVGRTEPQKPAPRDYLYVDEARLNSYLEQISSTETYDKVPSLRANFSLVGPSFGGEQTARVRQKTNHEKITELLRYLNDTGHLATRRPGLIETDHDDLNTPDFVLEQCETVRVLIPATVAKTTFPPDFLLHSRPPRHAQPLKPLYL